MRLNVHGRKFYTLQIDTEPAVDDWEASFDGGETWVPGVTSTIDGVTATRWLLAGPLAPVDDELATVIADGVEPMVRATSTAEVLVEVAPFILVES